MKALSEPVEKTADGYWDCRRQLTQDYCETVDKLEHLAGRVAEDYFSATSRTEYKSAGFNSNVDGWTVSISIRCTRNNKPQATPKVCPACQQKSLQP